MTDSMATSLRATSVMCALCPLFNSANSQQPIANSLNLRPTLLSGVGLVYANDRAVVLYIGVPGGGDGECGAAGGGVDVK